MSTSNQPPFQAIATLEIHDSVTEIGVSDWNAIIADGDPFLDYAFLSALERHGAVGERFGWLPRIVAARTEAGVLIGAMPMYEKDNSYGELVFDWAWADAYARSGGRYYPKLVVGIPYTPATGARLLVHADAINPGAVRSALIDKAVGYARNRGLSSIHWLFPNERDMGELSRAGMDWRLGTQFHWFNRFGEGYRDFEDYLSEFSSAKRKKLRRERRRVEEQGIVLRRIAGHEVTASEWAIWQRFYQSTFDRKSGYATLSESFFADIGTALGDRVLLVLAEHRGRRWQAL